MSNATILNYINDFYQEEFIAELNLSELKTFFEFNTTEHDEDYPIAAGSYYVVDTPIYSDGSKMSFFVDTEDFFDQFPQNVDKRNFGNGDASTVTFTDTLEIPIKPGTVVVEDSVEVFSDDSAGTLTGNKGGSGTIDYTTGALSVTFNTAPTNGQKIYATYEWWETGQPIALLWDAANNQVILRPVPDRLYKIKMQISIRPTAFSSDSDTPVYDDWGPVIAYGAAMDLLSDYEGEDISIRLRNKYVDKLNNANRRFVRQFEGVVALANF